MSVTHEIHAGVPEEEIKIVVNSLYLSMAFLIDRIEQLSGRQAAIEARESLIENLKYGNVDMAVLEDRKTFDFVVSVAEKLPVPGASEIAA
ncbi:MAG: hypothetical protein ABS76_18550 [Pelagibacterium sp. SCN 64-44]|nr:MAG: hypothetical protein ABS76_18550 [Pelagibacterium sp. SCN 64-44]